MASKTRRVDRSDLPLSESARHVVVPAGVEWSLWDDVSRVCYELGDEFDTWQHGLGEVALGVRGDDMFAASIGGVTLSIPRQVAKTFLVGRIVFALAAIFPNTNVIWTAHRETTSNSAFRSLLGLANRPAAGRHVLKVLTGDERTIYFHNGSLIRFGARAQNFGRGETEIDVLVFDEAQILSHDTLENMVPAANQARLPHGALLFFMGTPPRPKDDGEEFRARREEALEGKPADRVVHQHGDAVYIEYSADKNTGLPGGPDAMDEEQLRKANPSYPKRTPRVSILRMRKNLKSLDSWRREALGIWDERVGARRHFPPKAWASTATDTAPESGKRAFGVAFSQDGSRISVAGAVAHPDGVHVELIGAHDGEVDQGVAPLAGWLAERWRTVAAIAVSGPDAPVLLAALDEQKVPRTVVKQLTTSQYFAACSMLDDQVKSGTLTRPRGDADDRLDASIAVTDQKRRPSGAWGWTPTTPDGDETPVEAISVALYAARTTKRGVAAPPRRIY